MRGRWWYARLSSSLLPDTTRNISWSLTSQHNAKPKFGLRLLAAPAFSSLIGPRFQRPWALAFWKQQNLHLFLMILGTTPINLRIFPHHWPFNNKEPQMTPKPEQTDPWASQEAVI